MAGNYPDAPSWRMAWDKDGSTGFTVNRAGLLTEWTSGQKASLNGEGGAAVTFAHGGSGSYGEAFFGVVFPEPRDIDGYLFIAQSSDNGTTFNIQVSPNTTNGQDGTWTNIANQVSVQLLPAKPTFRTAITSSTQLNMRGIRLRTYTNYGSTDFAAVHIYGEPVPGANPNRLELWHPTLNEKLPPAYLDWGNVPRSSSEDRAFRVKNLSASQTAGAVRVAMEVLTDGSPSVPAQHTLSYAGGSYLAQVNIGDLAPGAISGPVTMRRITPSNAALGVWAFRVFAESTAWA